jgi:hypothetical protein
MVYVKRTRTGHGFAKGGLNSYIQEWSITFIHPEIHNNMKIEISNQLFNTDTKQYKEYNSLRFNEITQAKEFMISLLLAMKEYIRYHPEEKTKEFKYWLERIPDIIMSGHFDSRMYVLGKEED